MNGKDINVRNDAEILKNLLTDYRDVLNDKKR